MKYNFQEIQQKWQGYWKKNHCFKTTEDSKKEKYYILDMFPYPSGAGLHIGHPLGYIASDIFARYKRLKGFNVLHPMGYDAFGLPAEQYAIETGKHPADTTNENIKRYREQLDNLGFSFDWSREVITCDPKYYHWTQWTFIKMFEHWYDRDKDCAREISELIEHFKEHGNKGINAHTSEEIKELSFDANYWNKLNDKEKEDILQNYRLAFNKEVAVNWCPALKTVLANDEVKDGLSERGGHPVEQRMMKQWCLRISAYAQRLLDGLDKLEWSESLKEIQKNWIGKSVGASISFKIDGHSEELKIFTTRPDTIFGVSFMVLAPEHKLVKAITSDEYKMDVKEYVDRAKMRSERQRMVEIDDISGVFTGVYCIHPFTNKKIPIWVSDYVLANYGTGAIMAVAAHDNRDYLFAKKFSLPIIPIIKEADVSKNAYEEKIGELINSQILDGLNVESAIDKIISLIREKNIGKKEVNFKLRDAIFSRQRYWGEPIPIYYKDDLPYALEEKKLPLLLPKIDTYLPTENGDPPLARASNFKIDNNNLDLNTMPGFAGSSAYYLRYMDPNNKKELVSKIANNYWRNVDLYVGGAEHATGHLIYSRFWNKFLFDLKIICEDEPFKKLINQGMIQGRSNFVYRLKDNVNTFVSKGLKDKYNTQSLRVDVNIVDNDILDIGKFRDWRDEYQNAEFILEDGVYNCGYAIEKMSKSFFNVVNPDDIIKKHGADSLRLYEMFLGPIEQSKPWNTNGIEGINRFLNKFWKLFIKDNNFFVSNEKANNEELKILHRCLKKMTGDIESFNFNTAISAIMICVNDLTKISCRKKEVLSPLIITLAPFAPHICEELWSNIGNKTSIQFASWPEIDESKLERDNIIYAVAFNGKTRFTINLPINLAEDQIKKEILGNDKAKKYLKEKQIIKIIVVKNKIINFVLK